jgi:hypothetical protein
MIFQLMQNSLMIMKKRNDKDEDRRRESATHPAFRLPPESSFPLQPPNGILSRPLQGINMGFLSPPGPALALPLQGGFGAACLRQRQGPVVPCCRVGPAPPVALKTRNSNLKTQNSKLRGGVRGGFVFPGSATCPVPSCSPTLSSPGKHETFDDPLGLQHTRTASVLCQSTLPILIILLLF